MQSLTPSQQKALLYRWEFWARPKQLPPAGNWRYWFVCTGRGFGKTRLGAEWVRALCENEPGHRIMLVAPTLMEVRETMIEGESGILSCCPPWHKPIYKPSRMLLVWSNGSMAKGYSADKPDRLRGPNVTEVWADEFAAWKRPEAFQNVRLCLRKGHARALLTSTPKPTPEVRALFEKAAKNPELYQITQGSTWENQVNLSEEFRSVLEGLEGTRMGRQEIDGLLLDDVDGALWSQSMLDAHRVTVLPDLVKKAVFLDPSASNTKDSDETGIVVIGQAANKHLYVIGDYSVKGGDPRVWLPALARAKTDWGLDTAIVERNQGGLTLAHTIRNSGQGWRTVQDIYTTDSKRLRAEPTIPLMQQGLIHFYGYNCPKLENQMTTCVLGEPNEADDRIDAYVLGVHHFLPGLMNLRVLKRPTGW